MYEADSDPAHSGSASVSGLAAGVDPAALVAGLSTEELLAVADHCERRLMDAPLSRHTENGLLDLLEAREETARRREVFDAALFVEISDRCAYRSAGYKTMHQLYSSGLRLGEGQARLRSLRASKLGRLCSVSGERLAPALPATAAGVADGVINAGQVAVIAETLDKLPSAVSAADRAKAEASLAEAAATLNPAGLATVGTRILAYLDPDGTLTDERDRQRRRMLLLQPQNRRLESKVRALLTPELRVHFETMMEMWAAPGMNNPDDPHSPSGAANQPGLDPAILAAAADRDSRSKGQRQHDALLALLRMATQVAGQVRPGTMSSQIVITAADTDLAAAAGIAWSATGSRLPVTDLVKFAARSVPYLAVFEGATAKCLYLGRAKRFADHALRLAVFARDRGCTAPGCTQPFSRSQVHHMPDWAKGGSTDIDHTGAACGDHNRWNGTEPGQWETRVIADGPDQGRVGWRPAGGSGPFQVNPVFHPERVRADTVPLPVNHGLGRAAADAARATGTNTGTGRPTARPADRTALHPAARKDPARTHGRTTWQHLARHRATRSNARPVEFLATTFGTGPPRPRAP